MAGFLADHIQLALQRVDILDVRAGADEYLADHRLDVRAAWARPELSQGTSRQPSSTWPS